MSERVTLAVYVLALAAAVAFGVRTVDAQSSGRGLRLAGAGALLDAPRRVPVPHTGTSRPEHTSQGSGRDVARGAWASAEGRYDAVGLVALARRPLHVSRPEHSAAWYRLMARGLAEQRTELRRANRVLRGRLRRVRVSERYGARYAIHLAATTYGVDEAAMLRVAECESPGLQTDLVNVEPVWNGEHATGILQFLPSTFSRTIYGRAGFDIFDPVANALAGAWLVRQDGGWSEWACKP